MAGLPLLKGKLGRVIANTLYSLNLILRMEALIPLRGLEQAARIAI